MSSSYTEIGLILSMRDIKIHSGENIGFENKIILLQIEKYMKEFEGKIRGERKGKLTLKHPIQLAVTK